MSIFNNSQKLILNKLATYLLMAINTWKIQLLKIIEEIVTPKRSP